MTSQRSKRDEAAKRALLEAAAAWHARLREPDAGSATRAAFERWCAEDPRHAQAYEETCRLWAALELPVARLAAAEQASASVRSTRPRPRAGRGVERGVGRGAGRLALAACLLLALVTGGLLGPAALLDRLRADAVTATGEQQVLTLADGSRIVLGTDTALAVEPEDGRRVVRLFRGEAWFEVESDPARPFLVESAFGSLRVTGTRFDVRLEDAAMRVGLADGRLELLAKEAGQGGGRLVLQPGEQAVVTRGGITPAEPFDVTAVTAWRRGQLVFYDRPLGEVVAELNRYRAGRILLLDGDLSSLRVSAVFDTTDPDAALAVITSTLPVEALSLTDYLVLLH